MSKLMKNGLLLCLVAAFVLCGTVNLFAGEVASNNDKVSVSFYGQVNRAMSLVNDGDDNYLNHVDNDNSSTRFGFRIKAKGSNSLTASAPALADVDLDTQVEVVIGRAMLDGATGTVEWHDATHPIPVVFPLSSWAVARMISGACSDSAGQ